MKANKRIRDPRRRPKKQRLAIKYGVALIFVTTWPLLKKRKRTGEQKRVPGLLVKALGYTGDKGTS